MQTVSSSCVTNTYSYDALGRLVSVTDGRGNTTHTEYNAFGQQSASVDALSNRTSYAYDQFGRLVSVTNALGVKTVVEYDLRGRKVLEHGGTYPVRYTYNIYGEKTTMTTYRQRFSQDFSIPGDVTTWLYDDFSGALTNKVFADGTGIAYDYTPDGRLASRTWARGVMANYTYDGWGNITNVIYSDGTPSVAFSYDVIGRQTSVTDAVGVTTFTYDDSGACIQEEVHGLYSKVIVRHRDGFGRGEGYSIDNVRMTEIDYEENSGRIYKMKAGDAWISYSYLEGSDLCCRVKYNDLGYSYFTYEPKRDLLTQVKNEFGDEVISQYDYLNDAIGRRVAMTRAGSAMFESRTDVFGYNNHNELISITANTDDMGFLCEYDDIGNRVMYFDQRNSCTYTVNGLNQYTSCVATSPSTSSFIPQFDSDGNQTLVKTTTGVWSVSYNAENRPVLWTSGTTNIIMTFDRMGRRVECLETVSVGNGSAITNAHYRFVYDGYLCVQRLDAAANNSVDLAFVWDPANPDSSRPLMIEKPNLHRLFVTHDGNKNVSELMLFAESPIVVAHYEYTPFGALVASTRNTSVTDIDFCSYNPFRYSSEYTDDVLGLIYYNFRHYNCVTGRMLSRDPLAMLPYLVFDDFLDYSRIIANTYRFVSNNPVSCYDFLGREEKNISRTEIGKPWWMSSWLIWPQIIPNPKDVYGNYCGACRINGKFFDGDGQKGWKSEEIGEGCKYYYYDETSGEKHEDIAPPPKDAFDRCCMEHDRCLADVEYMMASSSEKSKQTKMCDGQLSWCWLKAYFGLNLSVEARIKTTTAIPVMIVGAHPGSTIEVISDTVEETLEDTLGGIKIGLDFLGQGMKNAAEDWRNDKCSGNCLFVWHF